MKSRSCVFAIAILLGTSACYSYFPSSAWGFQNPQTQSNFSRMTQFKKTITTIFWVGEGATEDNGYIHNKSSYWDENWMKSYGGVDSPTHRKGDLPAAFTPKQNPFYIALPFAEVDGDGNLKEAAKKIPGFGENHGPLTEIAGLKSATRGSRASPSGRMSGPLRRRRFRLGVSAARSSPRTRGGLKAGLDISPAAAQYLGVEDSDAPSGASWKRLRCRTDLGRPSSPDHKSPLRGTAAPSSSTFAAVMTVAFRSSLPQPTRRPCKALNTDFATT